MLPFFSVLFPSVWKILNKIILPPLFQKKLIYGVNWIELLWELIHEKISIDEDRGNTSQIDSDPVEFSQTDFAQTETNQIDSGQTDVKQIDINQIDFGQTDKIEEDRKRFSSTAGFQQINGFIISADHITQIFF